MGWFLTWLAVGSRVSQSWCWPTGEWGGWLRSPGYLRAGIGLMVGGAGTQEVPQLVLVHWWVELDPRGSGCRALGVLKLVSACCECGCLSGLLPKGHKVSQNGVGLLVGRAGAWWS